MSRWKVFTLILCLGLGIGSLVPVASSLWYEKNRPVSVPAPTGSQVTLIEDKPVYHFELNQGVLSVLEGEPGTDGKVIIDGLSTKTWPKVMLEMAPEVKFYSLDEVQSFIDTVNEPLWQE